MGPLQANIGWKSVRKRENKYYRSVPFRSYPTRNRKFQKNSKNIQKIEKKPLWLHFKPKQVGKGLEREKIKIIVPFRSYPTSKRKFKINRKKLKILENTITASFEAKIGWKRSRKRENKNYRFVPFQPDV